MGKYILELENIIWGVPLVFLLVFTHIFFTIKLKYPQKNMLKGIKLLIKGDKSGKKGVSSFNSLMTILAGTLGTGNIIGIGSAICIGGVGSVFWIFVSGIFAIATKYAETYVVLKYRNKDKSGFYGGAMYVLKNVLNKNVLAVLFSIFVIITSFGMGAMLQSNAIYNSVISVVNVNPKYIAIGVTIICGYVIFGNEKRISLFSSIFVPIATIVYIYMCMYIIIMYRHNLVDSLVYIVKEALNFRAINGAIFGSVAIKALNSGLSKGLFSNEAGMGSSPIFNATVNSTDIKREAIIASTSVFIDTVILCTLTGIALVITGMNNVSELPIDLVKNTFCIVPQGELLLTFTLTILAIATIPCFFYYGGVAIKFLFCDRKIYYEIYKCLYLVCIYVGSTTAINIVWGLSSIANAFMVIPNIIMIYMLKNKIE